MTLICCKTDSSSQQLLPTLDSVHTNGFQQGLLFTLIFIPMFVLKDFYWFTVSGKHTCFVCKSSEGEVKQCRVAHCGKFYHLACISKYPHARIESNSISCPLHVCGTCYTENPKNSKCSKGKNSWLMVCSHLQLCSAVAIAYF